MYKVMDLSYCISTYNRANLLNNSLHALVKQEYPVQNYEVIVVDDNSEEDIYGLCQSFKGTINLHYLRLEHGLGWRDCTIGMNFAMRRALGEVWAVSHPEIVISPKGIDVLYSSHFRKYPLIFQQNGRDIENLCLLMFPLFLSEGQFSISDYNELEYSKVIEKYYPEILDKYKNIRSMGNFVCMSMKKTNWERMSGFYEFISWGSADPDHQSRRNEFKIADALADTVDGICLHQYHPKSKKSEIGHAQLESRPFSEATIPLLNLSREHEEELKGQLVKEEYWKIDLGLS
jgi:glycosyltransferase involved in cell wall biosynthesis